jgi:hypothetical protein
MVSTGMQNNWDKNESQVTHIIFKQP